MKKYRDIKKGCKDKMFIDGNSYRGFRDVYAVKKTAQNSKQRRANASIRILYCAKL